MLDDGEVFDSSLLKETVNSFIATGKRNVVVDLMQLDYIYSDSINVLMALNKRVSDVSGCLALMSPTPEVAQILQKAGIYNVLRVFNSDEELATVSEEIMSQSSAAGDSGNQSLSEFDQLRSEIGSVFGDQGSNQFASNQNIYSSPDQFGSTSNQDQQNSNNKGSIPIPPNGPRQSSAPRPMPPQGPYTRPGFPNQQPQFQSRQFNPPPPNTTPRPIAPPPVVQSRGFENVQKPPARPYTSDTGKVNQSDYLPETQRFQPVPSSEPKQPKKPEPPVSISFNAEIEEISLPVNKPQFSTGNKAVHLDAEDDLLTSDENKKKPPVLVFALAAIVLLAIIGGVLFGFMNFTKKTQTVPMAEAVQTPVPKAPTVPPPPAVTAPVPTQQVAEENKVVKESEPVKTQTKKLQADRVNKKAAEKTGKQEKVAQAKPVKHEPVIEKKPEPAKTVATVNKVCINSVPSGAAVLINGDPIGKTPLVWDKPVFGPLSIQLTKAGYKSTSKDLEFTGGIVKEDVTLEKDIPLPPPKPEPKSEPVVQPVTKQVKPEPVVQQQPVKEPEPEPAEVTPEPVKTAPPPPPAVASGAGDASIFIASIPPVADVYLNGKLIGRTNVSEIKLPPGTMMLRFVKGPKEMTQEVTVQPGKNPSRLVRLP